MGWQGTLVLTLWLPKVLGLVTRKVLFFFFFLLLLNCSLPSDYSAAKRSNCSLEEFFSSSTCSESYPSPRNCLLSECALTTADSAALTKVTELHRPDPVPLRTPPTTRALADGELSRATRCIALCQVLVSHTDSLILYLYTWWECTCTSLCAYNWWACLPDQTLPALSSTSAGHVERGKHTNTPVGENKGAVLVCLLDIERSLGML